MGLLRSRRQPNVRGCCDFMSFAWKSFAWKLQKQLFCTADFLNVYTDESICGTTQYLEYLHKQKQN